MKLQKLLKESKMSNGMKKYILFSIIVLATLWVLGSATTQAATYYVRTDGHDTSCKGTADASVAAAPNCAYLTVTKAASVVASGDTVIIGNGTYTEASRVIISASGTSGNLITFRAQNKWQAIINVRGIKTTGDYIKIDGLKFTVNDSTPCIWAAIGSDHVTFTNNWLEQVDNGGNEPFAMHMQGDYGTITNNYLYRVEKGIGLSGSYNTIDGNEIDTLWQYGQYNDVDYMRAWGIGHTIKNNNFHGTPHIIGTPHIDCIQTFESLIRDVIIENNYCENAASFFMSGFLTPVTESHTGIVIRNNVQLGGSQGVVAYCKPGIKVYNNTFINLSSQTMYVRYYTGGDCTGAEFKNNIMYNGSGGQIAYYEDCELTHKNNIVYKPGFTYSAIYYDASDILNQNPLFVNYAAKDFKIQSGSPAKDAGLTLTGFSYDKDGVVRPQGSAWDIGAYEYTGSTPPTYCGDTSCNGTETCSTCPSDCGVCSDTQSPSIPTNLSAAAVSSSQINLSWTASTDNVGVVGYRIYRSGTQIGTSVSNSYSNTGLSANTTYSYTVSAYDAAGNVSAQSSSASATTLPPSANIEAESGTLTSPMQIISDSSASGGSYIRTNTVDQGTASYSFNIANAGVYKIIARVYAPDGASDSFYFKVDDSTEDTWDLNPTGAANEFNVWREDEVTKRGTGTFDAPQYDPYTVSLTAGNHTLTFRGRETNARLDYFYLVKITDTTPPAAPTGLAVT